MKATGHDRPRGREPVPHAAADDHDPPSATDPNDRKRTPESAERPLESREPTPRSAAGEERMAPAQPGETAAQPEGAAARRGDASARPEATAARRGDASARPEATAARRGDASTRPEGAAALGGVAAVRPGVAPLFAAVIAAVAGVSYATFMLEHLLSPALDVVNGYVSELSARDQPYHLVYSGGDLVTGVLSIIVAGTALATLRRRFWSTLGWSFLGLFGLCAMGDALFPLDCAPSLETWCALRERADQVSFSHSFHSVTSSAVIACGVAALLTLSIAARRYGWWPALARFGWLLAVVETAFALATVVAMLVGEWLGILQRIQISILCLGLLTIAWALWADWRAAWRAPQTRPVQAKETTAR
ncbi:DUF998 domain-containing protein [Actinomadura gamaensis]|uniref:DUF998 domain-containing protein n=1 Tax=Actinomadura gamaensis TaxID=1763541 RepID=A0ABV9U2X5_9ACTN